MQKKNLRFAQGLCNIPNWQPQYSVLILKDAHIIWRQQDIGLPVHSFWPHPIEFSTPEPRVDLQQW